MNAKAFLAEFGHIASAPGGARTLRELIYSLAVVGALTEQRSEDGNAQDLLTAIGKEKHRRILAGTFKRTSKLEGMPQTTRREVSLPPTWCWSRLVDIGEISPKCDAGDDVVASFVPMSGVPHVHGAFVNAEPRQWRSVKKGFTHFANGDVVVAKITPCFENGKAAVIEGLPAGVGAGTTELHVVRPVKGMVDPRYVYVFVKSPLFAVPGRSSMTGTAGQKRLPTEYFATTAFPLPPLGEQQRIVAKVDELMALCDKLEAQWQRHSTLGQVARLSIFDRLQNAGTPDEIAVAWERVKSNATLLIDSPEGVQSYRDIILDLAVSGLLLPPRPVPGATGKELLARIDERRAQWANGALGQEQKEALAMQRKTRGQRVKPPDIRLPAHWAWGSLLQVAQALVDCHNKTAPYVSEGVHLVRTTDVRDGRMDLRHTRKISRETHEYWARRLPPKAGDIFFTREAPMGEAAIVPEGEMVCLGQRTMLIRLFPELFNIRFLLHVVYSPAFQKRMVESAIGMTVKHLRVGGVEDLMVPVPPKDEQDRIVAMVDALLTHCDRLADQLARKQQAATSLAQASVAAVTGIRTEERPEMKAPKTELISTLQLSGTAPPAHDIAPLAALLARHPSGMPAKSLWGASGLEIDAFYRQLKTEMANGWIAQPEVATVREVASS